MSGELLDRDALQAWVAAQRWFGGKGREGVVDDVELVAVLRDEPTRVELVVAHLRYPDGTTQDYQLPLVLHGSPQAQLEHVLVGEVTDGGRALYAYDALHDKDATNVWRDALRSEGDTTIGGVTFTGLPAAQDIAPDAGSIVLSGEQSNTSLILNQTAILKVFRRLVPGTNPDIEVHAALARVGCAHIAAPLGWVTATWREGGGEPVEGSLAMLQELLRDASGGWELAQTSVRDLFAEADLHADEVGGDFAGESHRLGVATAEVHADLARALPTSVLDTARLEALAAGMRERLDAAASQVPELLPYVEALRTVYATLAARTTPVHVQRIHGDYHLGQVMRTTQGWRLLDFEGEPAKELAERRALDSPLRDVAGMLRSFDYAASHQLAERRDLQLTYRAGEWAQRNREAFCDGYAEAAGADPRDQADLLRAYETDKAVYEVLYEARNRPSWLRIPMSAIERIATTSTTGTTQ